MDIRTGAIVEGDDEAIAKLEKDLRRARATAAEQLVPVPEDKIARLRAMNANERKDWARHERNKRKAARRAARAARRKNR